MKGLSALFFVTLILVPLKIISASAFQLNVGLYDATTDSGNVTIAVDSKDTHKLESQTIDVGKIAEESGGSTITGIIITFSEKDLPPNGSFMACAYSDVYDRSQCEVAERHYDVKSADVWIKVPG
jgi:hypothetical protein